MYKLEKGAYYYYNLLENDDEKRLYRKVLYAVSNIVDQIKPDGSFCFEQLERVSLFVCNDRPDLFWYNGKCTAKCNHENIIVDIEFSYNYSKLHIEELIKRIESSTFYKQLNNILISIDSDADKLLALYEYIINNTEYDKESTLSKAVRDNDIYGIEGVVLKNNAVCSGYAKTFQYFASKHNIWATLVSGVAKNERHAWNLVCLKGKYYYIDVTWGDQLFTDENNIKSNYINYDYFCITTSQLIKSHNPVFDERMPLCDSTTYNYYVYKGMIEGTYSPENVAMHINKAMSRGEDALIKYANEVVYKEAIEKLFKKSDIIRALELANKSDNRIRTDKATYSLCESSYIIRIML